MEKDIQISRLIIQINKLQDQIIPDLIDRADQLQQKTINLSNQIKQRATLDQELNKQRENVMTLRQKTIPALHDRIGELEKIHITLRTEIKRLENKLGESFDWLDLKNLEIENLKIQISQIHCLIARINMKRKKIIPGLDGQIEQLKKEKAQK